MESITLDNFIFYTLFASSGQITSQWTVDELLIIYDDYDKKRFWKNSVKLPQLLETCLLLELANQYLSIGEMGNYDKYVKKAIEENPGDKYLLNLLTEIEDDSRHYIDWENKLFDTKQNKK